MKRHHRLAGTALVAATAVVVLTACGSSTTTTAKASKLPSSAAPTRGGTLTVLEPPGVDDWPAGLDPTTSEAAAANMTQLDAIYGGLFQVGAGGKTIDDLASGYKLSNGGKTLTVDIRKGVKFSNGAPFDAAAVVENWEEDMAASNPNADKPPWDVKSFSAPNADTAVINLKEPDGAIVDQFQATIVNWIASPTAEKAMGEKAFAVKPVGAGPFEVVSDVLSNKLVLKRNPLYWQKGLPYLNGLVFEGAASDESALEDIEAGDAQAYEGMGTPDLVSPYKHAGLQVTADEGSSPVMVQLNAKRAPFNSLTAREAIYYATDAQEIDKALYNDTYPVTESFTSSAGLFYMKTVPGYRSYDLAEAKKLVKSIPGGLSFDLIATQGGEDLELLDALRTMYDDAGMNVTISNPTLDGFISTLSSGKWDSAVEAVGSWDPAGQSGICEFFCPPSPFTGESNAHLLALIDDAAGATVSSTRAFYYKEVAEYMAQEAYGPFLFPTASWDIATKHFHGPGLTTDLPISDHFPSILWQDVYYTRSS